MKKIAFTIVCLIGILTISKAQVVGGQYTDLFDAFILGEYEECLDDALKYTEKDKTRRDAEPYLYAAMVYMKRYQDPNFTVEDKDDVLKDALKMASKFTKYDAKNEEQDLISQNMEPINELKRLTVEMAQFFYVEEDFRKSAYFLKKYYKVMESPQVLLALANCQILSRNITEGERNIKLAAEQLQKQGANFDYETNLDELTAKSFKAQLEFLKSNDETEKASEFLAETKFYFKNSEEMQPLFN